MSQYVVHHRDRRETMALSAAAMWGAAALVTLLEELVPGGEQITLAPGAVAIVVAGLLLAFGRRLPEAFFFALGPVGVAFIGLALATVPGAGDGAVLYIWPALWTAYFFGRLGSVLIVAWIGVVHALVLVSLPAGAGHADRWIDVMVTMVVVVWAVQLLQTQNQRLMRRLEAEARADTLTNLLNRRGFRERSAIVLARVQRAGEDVAVASFDIDFFKRVNDEHGHDAGDRVLVHLGEVFRAQARGTDVVARVGGEEFVALLPGCNLAAAEAFAERVRNEFVKPAGPGVPIATLSAGVTAAQAPAELEPLLTAADSALYAAKAEGRDRTVTTPAPVAPPPPPARRRLGAALPGT